MDKKRLQELAGIEQLNEEYSEDDKQRVVDMIVKMVKSEDGQPKEVMNYIFEEIQLEVKDKLGI